MEWSRAASRSIVSSQPVPSSPVLPVHARVVQARRQRVDRGARGAIGDEDGRGGRDLGEGEGAGKGGRRGERAKTLLPPTPAARLTCTPLGLAAAVVYVTGSVLLVLTTGCAALRESAPRIEALRSDTIFSE